MTTSSRRLRTLFVVAGLMLGRAAHAQTAEPSAADLESARELYRQGKDLRQQGDVRGALERFKAAHRYGQTPVTGLELGKTHQQLGELVEAREVFLSIARIKVAADETEKSAAARTEAAELAEQVRERIPTLVVKVNGVKDESQVKVTVDGAPTPVVSFSSTRRINPGEHAIVVRSADREEKQTVALVEGETKDVEIAITDASPKYGDAAKPAAAPGGARSPHVLTWIGLGVGVVGFAVGSITGVMALGKASNVKDACQGTTCPPSARADVEDGRSVATISTIGFLAGGVGLAAAAIGYFVLSPKTSPAATGGSPLRVRMLLHPSGVGLDGHF